MLAEAMADFEEQSSRPARPDLRHAEHHKDTAGFLRHFKGLAQETLAVPIDGEHSGRPAEEVAAFAQSVGLNAAACQSVDGRAALSWPPANGRFRRAS